MTDTAIVVLAAKYKYDFWRPVTGIRKADHEGNSMTLADQNWESLLESPPHPDYVSGHAGFNGVAAAAWALYFGADKTSFTMSSGSIPGIERRYESFRACAEEISMSRVYGGTHLRFSGVNGLECGRGVAAKVWEGFRGSIDSDR